MRYAVYKKLLCYSQYLAKLLLPRLLPRGPTLYEMLNTLSEITEIKFCNHNNIIIH